MATRKRPRPVRRKVGESAPSEATQTTAAARRRAARRQALEPARRAEEERKEMAEFLTMAEAAQVTGIDKYRVGKIAKRAGLAVYAAPNDARKKYLKRADLDQLTAPRLREPGDPDAWPPPAAGADSGAAE